MAQLRYSAGVERPKQRGEKPLARTVGSACRPICRGVAEFGQVQAPRRELAYAVDRKGAISAAVWAVVWSRPEGPTDSGLETRSVARLPSQGSNRQPAVSLAVCRGLEDNVRQAMACLMSCVATFLYILQLHAALADLGYIRRYSTYRDSTTIQRCGTYRHCAPSKRSSRRPASTASS